MPRIVVVLLSLLLLLPAAAGAVELRIASWNIERLGHGNHKSYEALGEIAARFDFLAVQEAMTRAGLERLQQAVQQASGEEWGMMYSHRLGRGSYKEKYAFLWRHSRVEYVDGAVVYLDTTNHFAREPYSARFRERASGFEFVAATVHITYGKNIADRTPEIHALREYWDWLGEVYPQTEARLLMGDFNLAPSHVAWDPLKSVARPLISEGASTLSARDRVYANLYDNIWVPADVRLPINQAGIFAFPLMLGWSHEKSRRHVSDHAPVYAALGSATISLALQKPAANTRAVGDAGVAVRGNRNSRIYHRPDCPGYGQVSEANRVPFASEQEAAQAGYRVAGNCP